MHSLKIASVLTILVGLGAPAFAQDGAPASPSGAPAGAAEGGSSEAGKAASTNEMKSHKHMSKKQRKMADPHKSGM